MIAYKVEIYFEHKTVNGWDDTCYTVKQKFFTTREKANVFESKEMERYYQFNTPHFCEETQTGDRYYTVISEIEIE